jgi:group I intron endonuclease
MSVPQKQIGIYKITSPSGKIYIGQSWNIPSRFSKYKSLSSSKKQRILHNSFKKYGWEAHKFEIIETFFEEITQKELDDNEIKYIKEYRDKNIYLLNIKEGGLGGKLPVSSIEKMLKTKKEKGKMNHSDETKLKISNSHKGMKHSKDTKIKMKKMKNSAKIILNTENGIFYLGTKEAANTYSLNANTLSKRFQGKIKNNTNLKYV